MARKKKAARPLSLRTELLSQTTDLRSRIENARADIVGLRAAVDASIANRPTVTRPFVCCVLEGTGPRSGISLATAGEVPPEGRTFELRSSVPVYGGRLIVFCDVSRITARVFCGVDLMHGSLDGAPVAYVPLLEVGVLLRVQCEAR